MPENLRKAFHEEERWQPFYPFLGIPPSGQILKFLETAQQERPYIGFLRIDNGMPMLYTTRRKVDIESLPEVKYYRLREGVFQYGVKEIKSLEEGYLKYIYSFDNGVRYLDYFSTDYKRNAYIVRDGETTVPESIQYAYDTAIAAQAIIRRNIKAGRTAGETLKAIVADVEREGYIYTPFIDIGTEDYTMIQRELANTDKPGISIDLHSQGNNGGSLVTVGPSMSYFRSDRDHPMIDENHFFSFEYMVHVNLPQRPGFPISLNIEGNHIVSSRGVEFLHPPNEKILLIH